MDNLLRFFGLTNIRKRRYSWLSTGERMRLVFAKALLNHPKIIIMDEPTIGLDPDMALKLRDEIKRVNKKFGTTILLASHYMQEVEYLADRMAFINNGRIVDTGTVKGVIKKTKKKTLEEYFIHMKTRDASKNEWRSDEK
ncbi:MAG: ATP-binding cassette domain-containing protein [Candidatus Aenigmatarchaeota archaeon]